MGKKKTKKFLESLTNKELVEFLTDILKDRRADEGIESEYVQAHWCLAEVSRMLSDDEESWDAWEIELLALHDDDEYPEGWHRNASICQNGVCDECNTKIYSWAKKAICPVCRTKVYAT